MMERSAVPLLSIIVPTRDGRVAAALPQAPDVEIIVVTGVSPVGRARNTGLRRATGDYIAWVDADDGLAPDWLAAIRAALAARPDAVVLDYVHVNGKQERAHVWQPSARGWLADVLSDRLMGAVWAFVVRRELWQGVAFDETESVAEDYRVLPDVLARVRTVARAGCVYRYIFHRTSLIHADDPAVAAARFRAAEARVTRWHGTAWAAAARASALKVAGWLAETAADPAPYRAYLRTHWVAAWRCRELSLVWKIKITLLAMGLARALRPVYTLHGRLFGRRTPI